MAKWKKNTIHSKNVQQVKETGLCMGCGSCEAVCPIEGAINVLLDEKKGVFFPTIDSNLCINCKQCLLACPGYEVDFNKLENEFIQSSSFEKIIGHYNNLYFGFANDYETRFSGASGGIASALLIYALENGIIDGALVLGFEEEDGLKTKPFIAKSRDEVLAANGSKYITSAINKGVREILNSNGRFAVVGLPCDIQAIRKMEMHNTKLREKIVFCIGLFCANSNTIFGTEYFLRQNGINPAEVNKIKYRAGGWPGQIMVKLKNGEECFFKRGTTETNRQKRLLFSSAFHYDFMIPRCFLCPDHSAELSDISLADPWLQEMKQSEKIGKSMIISRNKIGDSIIIGALHANKINLDTLSFETLKSAQNYGFKLGAGTRIRIRSLLGLSLPNYAGRNFNYSTRSLLEYQLYFLSYH
jgi:coenzyme F420 hydrogenase subunit beta